RLVAFDPADPASSSATSVDPSRRLSGLACPSTSFCAAVDDAGREVEGDPSTPAAWTPRPIAGAGAVSSLAWVSGTECIAGDAAGFVFVGTGPPVDQTTPSISGQAIEGRTLTEHHGTWTYAPLSYSYQWEDCDTQGAACTAIPNATGQTYVLTA